MSVKEITTDELRTLHDKEGIIFQGCGGEPQEWIDGINKMLTEANILKESTKFKGASRFGHNDVTCLLFEFTEDVKLDVGKLAIWRLQTHEAFGGTWLSDYVPNKLGGFIQNKEQISEQGKVKPDCPLIGQDGDIFNLMGIASNTLKKNGMREEAKEMQERITSSGSYNEALCIIGEYVNITSEEDMDEGMEMTM